jgi:hypothetical protein
MLLKGTLLFYLSLSYIFQREKVVESKFKKEHEKVSRKRKEY